MEINSRKFMSLRPLMPWACQSQRDGDSIFSTRCTVIVALATVLKEGLQRHYVPKSSVGNEGKL
eukprot:718884-Amphidinium_carterae.1